MSFSSIELLQCRRIESELSRVEQGDDNTAGLAMLDEEPERRRVREHRRTAVEASGLASSLIGECVALGRRRVRGPPIVNPAKDQQRSELVVRDDQIIGRDDVPIDGERRQRHGR